jgi:hypothetical protein
MDTQQRLEEYAVELDQAAAELERQPAAPQLNPKTFDERATLARAIAERVDVPSLAATWLVIARQYEYLALFPHSP